MLIIAALLVAGVASAQTPMMYEQEALQMLNSKMFAKKLDGASSDYPTDFSKNTLAFDNWHYAKVEFKDGSHMDSLRVNYDFNIDALVVQFSMDISAISLVSDLVKTFEFNDGVKLRKFVKISESSFEDIRYDMPFFETLLGDGETGLSMVKQYTKSLTSKDMQVTYGGEVAEDRYDINAFYFVKKTDETRYTQVVLSKKKIIAAIGKSQSKAIQKYAKENGLKWKDEFDAIKILRHFLN